VPKKRKQKSLPLERAVSVTYDGVEGKKRSGAARIRTSLPLTVCWPANRQSTKKHNTHKLSYIYSTPPEDGLQICPQHVGVD
jgi:hypothetical protein